MIPAVRESELGCSQMCLGLDISPYQQVLLGVQLHVDGCCQPVITLYRMSSHRYSHPPVIPAEESADTYCWNLVFEGGHSAAAVSFNSFTLPVSPEHYGPTKEYIITLLCAGIVTCRRERALSHHKGKMTHELINPALSTLWTFTDL